MNKNVAQEKRKKKKKYKKYQILNNEQRNMIANLYVNQIQLKKDIIMKKNQNSQKKSKENYVKFKITIAFLLMKI